MEWYVMNAVVDKFCLPDYFPEVVHDADMNALRIEIEQLMSSKGVGWAINEIIKDPLPEIKLECMFPEEAEERFLKRFYELSE